MAEYSDTPVHADALKRRLMNVYGIDDQVATRRMRSMASVVLAEMLPGAIVKGGTGLNLRYGPDRSRFSTDVDTTRPRVGTLDDFLTALKRSMRNGWNGFTATLREPKEQRIPVHIPTEYAMYRAKVKIDYLGSTFATVELEVTLDEVDSFEDQQLQISHELIELFTNVGLPAPEPVAIISPEHQIAQKLHACTTPNGFGNYDRAHDLVDIHLLRINENPDPAKVARIAERLFAFRNKGAWPVEVRVWPGWDTQYAEAAEDFNIPDLQTVVSLTNEFVQQCVEAARQQNH